METWIVADRETLKTHYGANLRQIALPPLIDLEDRARTEVLDAIQRATLNCSNAYKKGPRSFDVLSKVRADELKKHLPSFTRAFVIFDSKF
jgi:hypothetical protein